MSEESKSTLTEEDARTILKMEKVCFDEGTGPDSKKLLLQIKTQHPHLIAEFSFLRWPES